MIRLSTFTTLSLLVIAGHSLQSQDFLNFTALKAEGYGVYAYNTGHNIPMNVCGLDYAYYSLESAEISNNGYNASMHLVA